MWALVDTGASHSCIDSQLATQLQLPLVNVTQISGVHGAGPANVYLAQIHITYLSHTVYGQFFGVNLVGQRHAAIMGRAFLTEFTMTYDGATGTVTISM